MKLWSFVVLVVAAQAWANPRLFPFTYQVETLEPGEVELEQYVDLTPVRGFDTSAALIWEPRVNLQSEIEIGVSSRVDLGFYLVTSSFPEGGIAPTPLVLNGAKARARIRLSDPVTWPIDVGLYVEASLLRGSSFTSAGGEFEIEAKVLLQKRLDRVRIAVNLWAEHEWYFNGLREIVFNPTAAVSFEFSPKVQAGLEYWMRAEIPTTPIPATAGFLAQPFNRGPRHFVGPTLLVQFNRFWWSNGVYLRVDEFARDAQIGDAFGRFWVRSVIGVQL